MNTADRMVFSFTDGFSGFEDDEPTIVAPEAPWDKYERMCAEQAAEWPNVAHAAADWEQMANELQALMAQWSGPGMWCNKQGIMTRARDCINRANEFHLAAGRKLTSEG